MNRLSFTPATVFREEPEGGILFDVDTGRLKLVEGVAWGICAMIDEGSSREEILLRLRSVYTAETSLETDLDSFLKELEEQRFLRPPERENPCS